MFKHIFMGLEERHAKELEVIREQYFSEPVEFTDEPCVLHWDEAMDILKEKEFDVGDTLIDLNGAMVSILYFIVFILGYITAKRNAWI